jgi:hypothetical protein
MSNPRTLVCGLAVLLSASAVGAAEQPATDPAARYAVTATLAPALASADGRFRVAAEARRAPAVKSADGRFRVKVVAATCEPATDALFGNGFEPL